MTADLVPTRAVADWPAVLRYLGVSGDAAEVQALMLICDRYGLDPLLGHAQIIGTAGAFKPYITRDGLREIAHRSGQLDGIVVDELRRNSTGDGWTCFVVVWRKDMSHPFRVGAQCKDSERQAKQGYGPEQAMARAERRTLKMAFSIAGGAAGGDIDDEPLEVTALPPREIAAEGGDQGSASELQSARLPAPDPAAQASARKVVGGWNTAEKLDFMERFLITDLDGPWPAEAFTFALEAPF